MDGRFLLVPLLLLGACAHRPSAEEQAIADSLRGPSDGVVTILDEPSLGGKIEAVDLGPSDPDERHPVPTIVYFPPSFAEPSVRCKYAEEHFQPILSEFENRWYSHHLAMAGEPSLYLASQGPRNGGHSLRFTWLPTFDHSLVVRVETAASGAARLSAVMLSGAGGYDPGKVAQRIERTLTSEEARKLESTLARTGLFRLGPESCPYGADGSEWIFESVDAGGYHYLARWTPRKGPARKLGLLLLSLTGWRFERIY